MNGTYVDGKRIPKGQRSLLLDGSSVSLVSPHPDDDCTTFFILSLLLLIQSYCFIACVSFTFESFLSSLPQTTLSLLDNEFSDETHVVVSKRLQQLQSSAAPTMKNAKKPEYFIYVLKVYKINKRRRKKKKKKQEI